jgi:hypothetical protein
MVVRFQDIGPLICLYFGHHILQDGQNNPSRISSESDFGRAAIECTAVVVLSGPLVYGQDCDPHTNTTLMNLFKVTYCTSYKAGLFHQLSSLAAFLLRRFQIFVNANFHDFHKAGMPQIVTIPLLVPKIEKIGGGWAGW